MSSERRLRILVELGGSHITTSRLCEVSQRILGVTSAGIVLYTDEIPLGSACTTSPVAEAVENLQHALGEGPCVDAYRHDRPVLEPDLANPAAPRWPAFTAPALDTGARAIFAFPVGVGSARLGALSLCVDRPGTLTDDQHADALVMATVAAESLLIMQAGGSPGALAVELEANSNFHYVVHQAAGMLSAQLEVSVREALVRLRAHSFAIEWPLAAVAADVVGRRLRLSDDAG
ncbi:MAG TPA: GAF and ANTAR domain-containing protein [Acidimicrobiales bacterium]|nr:GAF and ANTAR domain-containing protein [Acidimicrobiales bacterium]